MKTILKKAKRTLSLLLVLLMVVPMTVLFAIPVSAETVKYAVEGGYIYFFPSTGCIIDCDESVIKADIPAQINGVNVTAIRWIAFENCTSLTSITIPDSVTDIGSSAFCNCTSLTSIIIPDSVTYIGRAAFENCTSLVSFKVSDGNKDYCDIEGVLFSKDKTKLICCPGSRSGSYAIPNGVTNIGWAAFGDTSLTSITIPDTVTSIESFAFGCCTSLKSITIPDGVISIEMGTFTNCTSLESIIIPKSVTIINEDAFDECDKLENIYFKGSEEEWKLIDKSEVKIPSSTTAIYNYPCSVYGHTCDEWITTLEPNCTIEGSKQGTCSICNETATQAIPVTGNHTYGEWIVTTDPGCAVEGVETRTCANCDAFETQAVPATGEHAYGEWTITTDANCTEVGEKKRYCIDCNAADIGVVEINDFHTWGVWTTATNPTCVLDGITTRVCEKCGYVENKLTPSTGIHIYGEWVITIEPTAIAKGEKSRKCVNCDATETEEIDKLEMTNPFTDVKDGQWYTEGILWCYQKGYMAGISSTEFGRKSNVSRAMFATILAKIDGSDISGYSEMSFTDVKPNQWYSNAIEWAASNGYAAGLAEGYFGYKENVSREQIALFFYTYSEKNGIDVSEKANLSAYTDLGRVHSWALDAMEWAVAKGLIGGTSTVTLSPRDSATRAEIALIVKNYVENVKN